MEEQEKKLSNSKYWSKTVGEREMIMGFLMMASNQQRNAEEEEERML